MSAALTWLRTAGSWLLALVVAVPLLGWLWQAYRSERAARLDAEARAGHAVEALAVAIASSRARAEALARADAQLREIHVQYGRDKGRIMSLQQEIEEIAGPDRAAQVWDRVFDRAPADPAKEAAEVARERAVAP